MGSGQRPLFNIMVVDGLAYQGILIDKMAEGMTEQEVLDEEYEEEYSKSGLQYEGRCEQTGY